MNESAVSAAPATIRLGRYLVAAHVGRVIIAAISLVVAIDTRETIPVGVPFGVALAALGLAWMILVALLARRLEPLLARRPTLVWIDMGVLGALMLLDKPWDSLVALPYGGFLLLLVYVRPWHLALAALATALVGYLPKLVLSAADWRYAALCPPANAAAWFTAYVGPIFVGTVTWALCALLAGVRTASADWQRAQDALTEAHLRRAQAEARRALADRLHETISQAARAIPLRLDGPAPQGLPAVALRRRAEVVAEALKVRSLIQRIAGDLAARR